MPLYEYRCVECRVVHEELVVGRDPDRETRCTACGSPAVIVPSSPALLGAPEPGRAVVGDEARDLQRRVEREMRRSTRGTRS